MIDKSTEHQESTNPPLLIASVSGCRILNLTLSKIPFDLMVSDNKKCEYRKPSKWIKSRLFGKEYDFAKFVNGYGNDKPYFIVEYKGYFTSENESTQTYPNLVVVVEAGDIIIRLGKIVERGNLNGCH